MADLIQRLKAVMPNEPDEEIAKDIDAIKKTNPAITDEEIFQKASSALSVKQPPAAPAPITPRTEVADAVSKKYDDGADAWITGGEKGPNAPVAASDASEKSGNTPSEEFGNSAALSALQGLSGFGDAIARSYGGQNTDYLNRSIQVEQKAREDNMARRKLISDEVKNKRSEDREDTKIGLEKDKLGIERAKAQAAQMKDLLDQMRQSGKDTFEMEEKLRNGFEGAAKSFTSVRDSYGAISAAAKEPSQAGDIALMTAFMKLIDPGSRVTGQEQATAENAGNVPEQVRGAYNRLLTKDGRLDVHVRADFLNQAKALFDSHKTTFDASKKLYDDLADSYKLDKNKVTNIVVGEAATPGVPRQTATNPDTGEKIESTDGGKTWHPLKK